MSPFMHRWWTLGWLWGRGTGDRLDLPGIAQGLAPRGFRPPVIPRRRVLGNKSASFDRG
jgi:hypothetical protein